MKSTFAQKVMACISFFALVTHSPGPVYAADDPSAAEIEARIRQINLLLQQHPSIGPVLGLVTGSIAVDGRYLLVQSHFSSRDSDGIPQFAALSDVSPEAGPVLPGFNLISIWLSCARGGPRLSLWDDNCWRAVGASLEIRPIPGAPLPFRGHADAKSVACAAIEELIVLLKARDDALR